VPAKLSPEICSGKKSVTAKAQGAVGTAIGDDQPFAANKDKRCRKSTKIEPCRVEMFVIC